MLNGVFIKETDLNETDTTTLTVEFLSKGVGDVLIPGDVSELAVLDYSFALRLAFFIVDG